MITQEELLGALAGERIVNVHTHHSADETHAGLNLQRLLQNSYVGWCAKAPDGQDRRETDQWLKKVRNRNYFRWLEKALMEIYRLPRRLDADTWEEYDRAVREAHRDPGWHLHLMQELCGYDAAFLDAFWDPGSDDGHPELFRPAYRINRFFFGYNSKAADHNGNNGQQALGIRTDDLDEYLARVDEEILRRRKAGAPVLKCALAYDRDLRFEPAEKDRAQRAMAEDPEEADVRAFQNYLFYHICELGAQLQMPLQIHTGLGMMRDSRAMSLQSAIAAHPETTFILMHGSYPWTEDIAGLTHTYPNVWADLCWLPLISSGACERFLQELLDVCNADRILWGCDTWTGEESYGAKLAFLTVLSKVLTDRVREGALGEADVLPLARMILRENAQGLLERI